MRSESIIVLAPCFKLPARIFQVEEQTRIEALVSEPAIEVFDEAVLARFARTDEVELHVVLVGLGIDGSAAKLGAAVHGDRLRQPADRGQSFEAAMLVIDTSAHRHGHSRVN